MTNMVPPNNGEIIELLRDDNEYYTGVGRDYLSASDISNILDGSYTKEVQDREWKIHFEIGKYFHVQTLEPHKLDKFTIKDVARRKAGDQYLKTSEVEMLKDMKASHDASLEARGLLYGPGVEYEVPMVGEIEGIPFKGKMDCSNPMLGWCVDLKSTSNLEGFGVSIEKWYCPQLWIYWKLSGMPTAYVAVDKKTLETQVIYPSKHFYALGKAQVLKAIEIYKNEYTD